MLSLNKVSKNFGEQTILSNLDFEFTLSNIYEIVGSNGSGKTTLLRIIAKLIQPTSGIISFNGKVDKKNLETYSAKIFVPNMQLFKEYTISENLDLLLLPRHHKEIVCYELEKLRIPCDTNISKISFGQHKMILLTILIVSESDVILLDEPFYNLDLKYQRILVDLLNFHATNKIKILTSHEPIQPDTNYNNISLLLENSNLESKWKK